MTIEMYEGIIVPEYCPRQRVDCKSLSQSITGGHQSFICCGENTKRRLPQDKYRLCFKNSVIDTIEDFDMRDIIRTAAVLMGAASIIEERKSMQ